MTVKRTLHAVYDAKYHLVWAPKCRKWMLRGDIRERVNGIFEEVALNHGFEIEEMEISQDHVHVFLSCPPRHSIFKVIEILKIVSASVIFHEHPEVKRQLWGGEFWEGGYFARTVGDKVTAEVIRKYIQYHRD